MRSRRWTRRWLVVINLLLLSAALPAVGHTEDEVRRSSRPAAQPRSKHRPAQDVTARKTPTGDSDSDSSDPDDDDGDGAGEVLGACCVGFVGLMADSAANDASDVEDDYRQPERSGPPPSDPWTQGGDSAARGSFDAKAAKRALRQAAQEVAEQCEVGPDHVADRKVKVTFEPNGQAVAAAFDPPFAEGAPADCVHQAFLGAQVPPFAGEPAVVAMTLEGVAPAAD